jgi:hypothetical protein
MVRRKSTSSFIFALLKAHYFEELLFPAWCSSRWSYLVPQAGIEPTTLALGVLCSIR